MRPTVFYTPEGYRTDSAKLMGRHAAGEAFLHAFLRRFNNRKINFLTPSASDSQAAMRSASALGFTGELECYAYTEYDELITNLLYLPTPGIGEYAWRRLRSGERKYSICGVTHTTASHRVMDEVANLLVAPVRPWDALICTSTAVRESINEILEPQMEYLRWKMGAARFELPQLPIIPLGVHSDKFCFSSKDKRSARLAVGAKQDDIVILFAGRLSFHAKAHPHPMFEASQRLAKHLSASNRKVFVVQSGWYANSSIASAFNEYAALVAPDVNLVTLDGRIPSERQQAWASADIFVSLSDNIQETFGLTPIEAMAAGLPSVVSDWNGYKDTIEHGVTGFRARTTMPPPGDGKVFAERYDLGIDSYDMYCGHTCELIGVDVGDVTMHLMQLADSDSLRQTIGAAAKSRSDRVYDWQVVIEQYEELWEHLDERRLFETDFAGPNPLEAPPHRPDPFKLYRCYPSEVMDGTTEVILNPNIEDKMFEGLVANGVHSFAHFVLPTAEEYRYFRDLLARSGPVSVSNLLAEEMPVSVLRGRQILSWMLKVGFISLKPMDI